MAIDWPIIGKDVKISIWDDAWIMYGCKFASVIDHKCLGLNSLKVCELLGVDGSWNLHDVANYIPPDLTSRIHALLPPRPDYGDDLALWPSNILGEFSAASSYALLSSFDTFEPSFL